MKVLFLSSEVAPFSKTGGLADVAEALPTALASLGHSVKVISPLYASIANERVRPTGKDIVLRFPFGAFRGAIHGVELSENHQILFIAQPAFFNRGGIYGEAGKEYSDNHRRFAFFAVGALACAQLLRFSPDVIHLNDWQTGLAALALARAYARTALGRAKRVLTIHNLAFQGLFPRSALAELGIPLELFTLQQLEFYGQLSFLKAGIVYSHALTTVSRKYAEEIQTPILGCGLDGLLRQRRSDLHGILNGVNYQEWTPSKDALLAHAFSAKDLSGKEDCKLQVLKAFGLPAPKKRVPLFGMVTRIAPQKGIDLVLGALPQMLRDQIQVVVLGSGDPAYENSLRMLAQRFPEKMGVKLSFQPELAHWVEAGADFFLMPSRYEPCGLNQMYSLRYGAVPIVRATGGLDDTVKDLSARDGTGIKFKEYSVQAMVAAMIRAVELYQNPRRLKAVRLRGMKKDFSWRAAARKYQALYTSPSRGGSGAAAGSLSPLTLS